MIKERIEKAIAVIEYATQNKISVREASVTCGYSNTYVKNIKLLVREKCEMQIHHNDLINKFYEAYKRYEESRASSFYTDNSSSFSGSGSLTTIMHNSEKYISSTIVNANTSVNTKEDNAFIEWKSGSNYSENHVKTLDELLDASNVDLNVWKVKEHFINKWDVTVMNNGFPQTIENWQVKARLEKDINADKERQIGELFKEMVKDYNPLTYNIFSLITSETDENNLFEITLFDLHIGKLAWGGETGENYDTKIARQRFLKTIETLIERASGFQFSRILFPIGSDFFNSDTIYNTTTKGTPQDEDLRWQKTFQVGVKLLVDAIDTLKHLGVPIDVVVIPGNHDFERSYYMGSFLEAWYRNDLIVKINNGASPRKYYRFGKVLLGLTHGSEEKESSLPLLMASDIESKPMWSETDFHEWHLGHIHRKRDMKYLALDKSRMTNEDLGVTIRYLSSLTGTEEWHHKKGFIGATKAGEAFIWNDKTGLIAHLNANLIIE
jgi:hypothetical protein